MFEAPQCRCGYVEELLTGGQRWHTADCVLHSASVDPNAGRWRMDFDTFRVMCPTSVHDEESFRWAWRDGYNAAHAVDMIAQPEPPTEHEQAMRRLDALFALVDRAIPITDGWVKANRMLHDTEKYIRALERQIRSSR